MTSKSKKGEGPNSDHGPPTLVKKKTATLFVGADVEDVVVITALTLTEPTVNRRADVEDATATSTAARVELAFAEGISVATITDPAVKLITVMSVVETT